MCIQALQPSVRIPACLLFAQFHHSSDASSGTFNHILRQLDFFSAASFQTVINIHQCCDLHIHTCQWNSQRIERLVRTIKLQMFYNTVFRSDNKFSAVRFLGIIHNTCCGSDIIGLFNHFLTASFPMWRCEGKILKISIQNCNWMKACLRLLKQEQRQDV